MFGSVALDVVIGLVFIYLLYSLLATTIQELLASWLKLRAGMLEEGIKRMLDDGGTEKFSLEFKNHPLIKYFMRDDKSLISFLAPKQKIPSYITPQNFSKVIVELMKEGQPGVNDSTKLRDFIAGQTIAPGDAKRMEQDTLILIKSFAEEANYDVDKFKVNLEKWFDDMMDRVSGWYKRKSQLWLLIIGMFIAISFNVDTIGIVKKLSHDKDAAKALADMASNYVKDNPDGPGKTELSQEAESLLRTQIEDANSILSLGYNKNSWNHFRHQYAWYEYIIKFFGWLLTALAICLGAPFWFDLLSKLVKIRSATKTDDESTAPKGDSKQTVQPVAISVNGHTSEQAVG